ncbi:MAG: UvrD-helicase domain-containing protein [Myxococcales bacterium]|nr:UvrD-helicase domain-containing protein [Myxococcales bacterium]
MSMLRPELVPLDAPTLVEASAGTGKTYAITTYFVRAILELGLEPEQILVVTYTKAATAELRVRARKRIAEALTLLDPSEERVDALSGVVRAAVERLGRSEVERRLRNAIGRMDQAAILTIHGFCQRLLQEYPLEFGIDFDLEVSEDAGALYSELAVDFWASELYDRGEWLLGALSEAKVGPDHLAKLASVAVMPGTEILGPEPRESNEETVADWLELRRRAAKLWTEERAQVCEILLNNEDFNRQKYHLRSIPKTWIPELDTFFADARFGYPPASLALLAQGKMTMKKGREEPEHEFFKACRRLWDAHEALVPMLDYAVFEVQQRFIERARRAARKRRDETAVFTFDDLLTAVYAPLHPSVTAGAGSNRDEVIATISKAYPLALVDEFQDTDSVQYGIFRAIYGEGAAVYVGDPKQAIYSFRGADVFSYIGASADVGERKHTLKTNWRSDPAVVEGVNALFSQRRPAFALEDIDFEETVAHEAENRSSLDPGLEVVFVGEDQLKGPLAEAVAPIVANEIALLLHSDARIDGRPVVADDVAVLCRSNRQANEVTAALRALQIPSSLDGGSSVLETEIASELRAVLEAALIPGDSGAVRRALLSRLLGVSPYGLYSMTDETWTAWVTRFREWNEAWHSYGVLHFLEDMLRGSGAETRIARQPAAGRELTDLSHLEELLLRGERERGRNPVALMQWLRRLSDGSAAGELAREELQQRPDADSGAVRVATIHKSKGLEYGIVYCPFTWNDAGLRDFAAKALKFHDARGNIKLDLRFTLHDAKKRLASQPDLAEHRRLAELEAQSDALRLLYVAVTRAKHRCTLFWGRASRWKTSALRYLLHGDDGFDELDETQMREAVDALVAGSSGSIGCRPPHDEVAAPLQREAPDARLVARAPSRTFVQAPRMASFTSLTGHDEKAPGLRSDPASAHPESSLFSNLAAGARTGLLLHSILEHADFAELGEEPTVALIERELRAWGFDPALAAGVQRDLVTVGSTPLTAEPGAPRMCELETKRQLRELEFTLRVDHPNLGGLAKLFEQHGAPSAAPGYHQRLAEVSSQTLHRYLRGYIDLLFQWEGLWYVADYKSNSLPAYDAATIAESVQREHYLLQAQLYTAAAHRYLKQRISGYDPETQWGGALFVFLRGMGGPESAGSSVFFDRASAELLNAVDRWLGGGADAR